LIVVGSGFSPRITAIAPNMAAAPPRCVTPRTRSVAKYRSATIPTKTGDINPAIGPTEYIQPKSEPEKPSGPKNSGPVTYQAPQITY
jgi:hypothetical protein